MANEPGVYDSPTRCTGGAAPGALVLRDTILGQFPGASDSGIYACRQTRTGQGLSEHAEGRAADIGVGSIALGNRVAAWAHKYAGTLGIQSIIWNDKVWTSSKPTWRPYNDPATGRPYADATLGHRDHVHIGLTRASGEGLNPGAMQGLKGPGAALAGVGSTVAGFGGDLVESAVAPFIDGLRKLTIQGAFIAGGMVLLAAGAYRAVTGRSAAGAAAGAGRLAVQGAELYATGGASAAARAATKAPAAARAAGGATKTTTTARRAPR